MKLCKCANKSKPSECCVPKCMFKCWADGAQMLKKSYRCVQTRLNDWRVVFLPHQLLVVQGFGRLSAEDVHLTLKDRQLHATLHVLLRFINAVKDELTLRTVPEPWEREENHSASLTLIQQTSNIRRLLLKLTPRCSTAQDQCWGKLCITILCYSLKK